MLEKGQQSFIKKNLETYLGFKHNQREVNRLRHLMQEQAKDSLQVLMSEYKQISEKTDAHAEKLEMEKQEQQLKQEIQTVRENQQELSSKCESVQKQKEAALEEKERLMAEKERLENETTLNIPIRREEIQLYTMITRIRWDFEGAEHEVKGFVSNKTDVKPFNFDTRKCSQFFITNALWDMMKED